MLGSGLGFEGWDWVCNAIDRGMDSGIGIDRGNCSGSGSGSCGGSGSGRGMDRS